MFCLEPDLSPSLPDECWDEEPMNFGDDIEPYCSLPVEYDELLMLPLPRTPVRFLDSSCSGQVILVNLSEEEPAFRLHHHETTEEGYRSDWESWFLSEDNETIYYTHSSEFQDCDGRYSTTMECSVQRSDIPRLPLTPVLQWTPTSSSRRDHSAEAAGY